MSCENVTVDYPSEKLIPILNRALNRLRLEIQLIDKLVSDNTEAYNAKPWYKKIFAADPDDWRSIGEKNSNWNHGWERHWMVDFASEIEDVVTAAKHCDTVRLSGECLRKIDKWSSH